MIILLHMLHTINQATYTLYLFNIIFILQERNQTQIYDKSQKCYNTK